MQRANELRLAYEYLIQSKSIITTLKTRIIVISLAGCMPVVHWLGYGQKEIAVVFEKIGPSLDQLFNNSQKKFSTLTVFYLMEKMVFSQTRL